MGGLLEKLRITSFDDPKNWQGGIPLFTFQAMFNPESFSIDTQIEYCTEEAPGSTSSPAKFRNIRPRSFKLDLLIDGTGASGEKVEVEVELQKFKATVGYFGKIHRPMYLVVSWGTFLITCVLESYSVNYKLFRPNGTPLRATISASFKEFRPRILEALINNKSSPDLTHSRQIGASDRLTLMVNEIYDTPKYYMQVAEFNQLNTIRNISVGSNLLFPPLK
ncbi:MAG: hypothetical protein DWQ02_22450 [Bacteroidetes bacterium]|nr:MAG: hypothetical protein DWQ02_22450 [Bacteroidota bacterium]